MNGVQFSEDEFERSRALNTPAVSKPARWLVARGIVRTEKEANLVLLGVAGILAALSFFIFITALDVGSTPSMTEAQRLRNELSTSAPKP